MSTNNSYGELLSYDKNGNIMTLQRNGLSDGTLEVYPIDNLIYTYPTNSNQLSKVDDIPNNNQNGFKDGANTNDDYRYYGYGNMTSDQNKGIASIAYNHLNLPVKIVFENNESKKIEYLYNAIGIKVLKKVTDGAVVTTTDYLTGYQYKNSLLQFFPTAEGYFKQNQGAGIGTGSYVFNYTDHLGNVRVSYQVTNNVLNILEENNYYPFGMKHSPYNESLPTSYKYKYNGKEFQDELGLNVYDYGARMYDPAIGRWMNVDPLAEEFPDTSPYAFVNNNPLRFTDPTGMAPEDQIDPPAKKKQNQEISNKISTLKNFEPVRVQGGYPGEGLDMLVTAGIQWLGEKISGSDVSKETSENVQFATSLAIVIVSKGKNAKADGEVTEQLTSRAARREVMRKEGIPISQQPKSQFKNSSGREYTYEIPKKGGGTQTKSVQQQTMDRSHQGQNHWEAGKVKTDNGATRMNNYGRPKLDNQKSKVDY